MKLIEQSWDFLQLSEYPLAMIERAGRTCYKSEDKITDKSEKRFVKMLLSRGHESVIEHAVASVRFITNRGVTHELVRHRLASFSQESTRYVNYGGDDIEFIKPVWYGENPDADHQFWCACQYAEKAYHEALEYGWRPEQAREVLPNALKTEIVVTANLREWRHIFKLRTSKAAHPQIRVLMCDCLEGFKAEVPILFDNINKG